RLARDRPDGEQRAQAGSDRERAAQSAARGNPASGGTDERQRELMIVVARMRRPKLIDGAPDGGFAAADRLGEYAEHRTQLRGQAFEVHSRSVPVRRQGFSGEKESQMERVDLNQMLRQSRNKR